MKSSAMRWAGMDAVGGSQMLFAPLIWVAGSIRLFSGI
jgi:hypothetical protein